VSPPEGQRSLVVTDEMRQAVRAEQCSFHGHSYDAIVAGTGEPVRFVCSQCGGSWSVVPSEEPDTVQPVPNQKGHTA
jgi:hypothetical protein